MLFFGLDNNQLNSNISYLNEIEDISKITHAETGNIEKKEVKNFIKEMIKKNKPIIKDKFIIQKIQKKRQHKHKKLIRKLAKIKRFK